MQTAVAAATRTRRRSLIQGARLTALILLTATASTIFALLTLGAQPAPADRSALSSDYLRAQQDVMERDEAAFAVGWAEMGAAEQAKTGTRSPAANTIFLGAPCGEDCLTVIWIDGSVSSTSMTLALDYATLCNCQMVWQTSGGGSSIINDR